MSTKQPRPSGSWNNYYAQPNPSPFLQEIGLTDKEKKVLDHLSEAWNVFIELTNKHPDHNNEFKDAINRCQYIIGVRVAQRVNPEIWYVPTAQEGSSKT